MWGGIGIFFISYYKVTSVLIYIVLSLFTFLSFVITVVIIIIFYTQVLIATTVDTVVRQTSVSPRGYSGNLNEQIHFAPQESKSSVIGKRS